MGLVGKPLRYFRFCLPSIWIKSAKSDHHLFRQLKMFWFIILQQTCIGVGRRGQFGGRITVLHAEGLRFNFYHLLDSRGKTAAWNHGELQPINFHNTELDGPMAWVSIWQLPRFLSKGLTQAASLGLTKVVWYGKRALITSDLNRIYFTGDLIHDCLWIQLNTVAAGRCTIYHPLIHPLNFVASIICRAYIKYNEMPAVHPDKLIHLAEFWRMQTNKWCFWCAQGVLL